MKKYLLLVFFLNATAIGFTQTDEVAKKLLNTVSKKYDSYRTMTSDFTLVVKDADKKSISNDGKMWINKSKNQYRIKIKADDIFSDGTSVWNVSNDLKEVQITDAENNTNSIGPNNLFSFYKSGYKYIGMPDESMMKDGKKQLLKVVELSPLNSKGNYFKIKLRINNNNHIHDVTIFDKSGNQYSYIIKTLFLNKNLPKSNFEFSKDNYKTFEIVDLR